MGFISGSNGMINGLILYAEKDPRKIIQRKFA
jgi:hypothetical protein